MKEKNPLFLKRSDASPIPEIGKPGDAAGFEQIGFPGQPPYTRGIHPTMYRGRLWTMRQYAGFGSAEETNRRFQLLLKEGQTGLSVAFDLPTQMGFDADHPMARGEVGRVGVSISSLEDMERLLDGIPLEKVSTSMTINSTAVILLSLYLAVAKKRGVPFRSLRGTIQNDILKEYIARGTFIYPPKPSLRIATDLIDFCTREVPAWNPISISGYHIREAGSDAVQEVAFTLANGIAYSSAALSRGMDFDAFAGQLSFFFASHNDFLEEIAKFRAARRLWAKIATDRFKAKNERSKLLRFHVQTAGSTLTAQQPDVNIVRVTLQAMAAVLGGCQSLHTNSRDEALALPTETSAMLALRTQQILAEESGIAQTIDPVGGSYLVEAETDRMEREAKRLIDEVTALGGSAEAIEKGYFQKAISQRAYEYQRQIESGERKIVGVNAYGTEEVRAREILRVDSRIEGDQRRRLAAWRTSRLDASRIEALKHLEEMARDPAKNIVPAVLAAVEAKTTLGEIADLLRTTFGTYQPKHAGF